MNKKNIPLGIILYNERIGILEMSLLKKNSFTFSWSEDGVDFNLDTKKVYFTNGLKIHKPDECSNFRFSIFGKKFLAVYTRKVKDRVYRVIAESKNIYEWDVISEELSLGYDAVLLEDEKINKNYILYENGSFIRCLVSKDLEKWNDNDTLLFTTRPRYFDEDNITLLGSFLSDKGIVLLYESIEYDGDNRKPCIGAVFFDKKDPYKIIWRSNDPIWKSDVLFSENDKSKIIGLVFIDNEVRLYLVVNDVLISISFDILDLSIHVPARQSKFFTKHKKNPIISPHASNQWENQGSFNPACVKDDDGYVHLLYRAIGHDGISRIGYNFSKDGINFEDRQNSPVFAIQDPRKRMKKKLRKYDPVIYTSGGSWGGCEDPRAVRIDGRVYVTFNAFDGWDFVRVALISIDENDLFNKKWKWSSPILISPSREINKNWVLFPEKINGKFAILHTIWPKVGIEYVDTLDKLSNQTQKVEKRWHAGGIYDSMPKDWIRVYGGTPGEKWVDPEFFANNPWESEKNNWDTWIRSAGPPPIKTDYGWLILYHATDEKERHIGYKLGAMLLDYKNPEKIIVRSKSPVLVPEKWYENDWKPGVVYACGAIVKDDQLFVYYGGGDKHICVATAPLDKFLKDLIKKK